MNTGIKQAIIARRVTRPGGAALDTDGNLCSESRKKQAILLLEGQANPDPAQFEVFTYFRNGEKIYGFDSAVEDLVACPIPVGYITLSESEIELTDSTPSATVTIDSSHPWLLTNVPADLTISPVSGNEGVHSITITSKKEGADVTLIFRNTGTDDTASLKVTDNVMPEYVKNPTLQKWIEIDPAAVPDGEGYNIWGRNWDTLGEYEGGGWNRGTYHTRIIGEYEWMLENHKTVYRNDRHLQDYVITQGMLDKANTGMTLEESYVKNGCYHFAGKSIDRYMAGLKVFDPGNMYVYPDVNINLFGKTTLENTKVENGAYAYDANYISFKFPEELPAGTKRSITREAPTSYCRIWRNWSPLSTGASPSGDEIVLTGDKLTHTETVGTYAPKYWHITLSNNGTPFENLPKIKIEYGDPTRWIGQKEDIKLSGWITPSKEDFAQLFGMCGDLSPNGLIKHLFVSSNDTELPWKSDFLAASRSEDLLGARFIPCGAKHNVTEAVDPLGIYNFGEFAAFGLYAPPTPSAIAPESPMVYISGTANLQIGKVVWDNYSNIPNGESIMNWQRPYRSCRKLTDEELGYRLWRDDANDRIIAASLATPQPAGTTELPKGLLRGLAVRWMNPAKTKVAAPLSKLLQEVEKTQNNGEYQWYGW